MKKRYVFLFGMLSGFILLIIFILTYVSSSSTVQLSSSENTDNNAIVEDFSEITVNELTESDYQDIIKNLDKKTLINFWASWCKPCIEEIPYIIEYCNKNNIDLILISADRNNERQLNLVKRRMKELGVTTGYIIKEYSSLDFTNKEGMQNFAKKTEIPFNETNSIPYFIYYDKLGKIINNFNGFEKDKAFSDFFDSKLKK